MRRALAAALGGAAVLLVAAGSADAALEPVTIAASAPGTVTAGAPFKLSVAVEVEAGALDIAAQPLLLGVKLAPECGGSLVGTPGPAVLERTLPTVPAGSSFAQAFAGEVTAPATGTEVVCAFLQDSQERQFATDTEAEVTVVAGGAAAAHGQQCTAATQKTARSRHRLRRLERRIARTRRELHHAAGTARKPLRHKLHTLRARHRKLARQRRRASGTAPGACS